MPWGRDSTTCCPKCKSAYGLCKGAKVGFALVDRLTSWPVDKGCNVRGLNGRDAGRVTGGGICAPNRQPLTANTYHA